MNYVREIFRYAGVPVDFEVVDIDPNSESNDELEYAITSIKRNGVAIKGNIETKSEQTGIVSRNVAIRNELDLFVSVLHCQSYPGVRSHHQNVDVSSLTQKCLLSSEDLFFSLLSSVKTLKVNTRCWNTKALRELLSR